MSEASVLGITLYGPNTLLTVTGLSTLADAATATSNAINNSKLKYEEILLNINVAGTATATAWLDVKLLPSVNDGVDYATFANGIVLPAIYLNATPQIYITRLYVPEYFKIAIKNNTGAVLTAGTVYYKGIIA